MKNLVKLRVMALLSAVAVSIFSLPVSAGEERLKSVLQDTAACVTQLVENPEVGAVAGEWAVIGLMRSGLDLPEGYSERYLSNLSDFLRENGGVLHERKYTEYSRVVLALTALGLDPTSFDGYNLLAPLEDFDKTVWQGINGAIFALLAADSGRYELTSRERYLEEILSRQLSDGGFALGAEISDPDITAMALCALAGYDGSRKDVGEAIQRALDCLSDMQDGQGGFSGRGSNDMESCAQVIIALGELGIPLDDPGFVKNGNTPLDRLLTFHREGSGFLHSQDEVDINLMATEQALCALAAARRFYDGESSFYRIKSEARSLSEVFKDVASIIGSGTLRTYFENLRELIWGGVEL